MKLSKNTFSILKNFSSLNSNILVKEGNVLKTLTPAKNVMAEATVEEDFSIEFGIWDLGKFLGTISLFSDPDFEFEDGYVSIKGSNNSLIKYYYSEPSLLTVPTKEINMPETVVSFGWKQDIFNDLQRAAAVLQLPDLCIRNDENGVFAEVLDKADPSSNSYSVELGDAVHKDSASFKYYFKVENLKMLPGDYTVNITEKVVSEFCNSSGLDLKYWVALESDSVYSV